MASRCKGELLVITVAAICTRSTADLTVWQSTSSPTDVNSSAAWLSTESGSSSNNRSSYEMLLMAYLKKWQNPTLHLDPSVQLSTFYLLLKKWQANDMIAQTTNLRDKLPFLTCQLPREIQQEIGTQFSSTFVKCSYLKVDCLNESNFRWDLTAMFGSCFTYNFIESDSQVTTRPGPKYGLALTLFTYIEDYICTTDSTGFKISLQSPTVAPFPDISGFYAAPGVATSVVIRQTTTRKIDDCTEMPNRTDYYYEGDYTTEGCTRSCYQKRAVSVCGCADPRFPKPYATVYCNVDDYACLEYLQSCTDDFPPYKEQCSCKQPCRETQYDSTVTTSAINFEASAWLPICAQYVGTVWNGPCEEYLRKSIAVVYIYYDRLSEIVLTEEYAYKLQNFESDMYDSIGFYLGVDSMLLIKVTIIVVDVFAMVLTKIIYKRKLVNFLDDAWTTESQCLRSVPPNATGSVVHNVESFTPEQFVWHDHLHYVLAYILHTCTGAYALLYVNVSICLVIIGQFPQCIDHELACTKPQKPHVNMKERKKPNNLRR